MTLLHYDEVYYLPAGVLTKVHTDASMDEYFVELYANPILLYMILRKKILCRGYRRIPVSSKYNCKALLFFINFTHGNKILHERKGVWYHDEINIDVHVYMLQASSINSAVLRMDRTV